MTAWEWYKQQTDERFRDPRPGDVFEEMFTFWVIVKDVGPDHVTVTEGSWKQTDRTFTRAEFATAYAYGSIPGYWVTYWGNGDTRARRPDEAITSAPEGPEEA